MFLVSAMLIPRILLLTNAAYPPPPPCHRVRY